MALRTVPEMWFNLVEIGIAEANTRTPRETLTTNCDSSQLGETRTNRSSHEFQWSQPFTVWYPYTKNNNVTMSRRRSCLRGFQWTIEEVHNGSGTQVRYKNFTSTKKENFYSKILLIWAFYREWGWSVGGFEHRITLWWINGAWQTLKVVARLLICR